MDIISKPIDFNILLVSLGIYIKGILIQAWQHKKYYY